MPTVVITGANRGIGLELARQYAEAGWHVVAGVRRPHEATELAEIGGQIRIDSFDAADPASIDRFAAAAGAQPVDLLINNAGVMGPPLARQSKDGIDVEGWVEALRVNTIAPALLTLALADRLAQAKHPVVAVISSTMGSLDDNGSGGAYAYRTSKAGVNMVVRSLAADLRSRGIIAVTLHPGWVQTAMGGPNAPLPVRDSAAGIRRVLAGLRPEDSGRFLAYDGAKIPW